MRQLCDVCDEPTGRTEEDQMVDRLGQVVCEGCLALDDVHECFEYEEDDEFYKTATCTCGWSTQPHRNQSRVDAEMEKHVEESNR